MAEQPAPQQPSSAVSAAYEMRRPSKVAPALLCIGFALLIAYAYPRTYQWLGSALFGTHFEPFFDPYKNIVPYLKTPHFWMDMGSVTLSTILLIKAATILLSGQRRALLGAFVIFVTLAAYNAVYTLWTWSSGIAFISVIAAVVGSMFASDTWQALRAQRSADQNSA